MFVGGEVAFEVGFGYVWRWSPGGMTFGRTRLKRPSGGAGPLLAEMGAIWMTKPEMCDCLADEAESTRYLGQLMNAANVQSKGLSNFVAVSFEAVG